MGLFEKFGRRVERFKQEVEERADEQASHKCENCGTVYYIDQDECEDCGENSVVPIETN